jgi:hypothetical protein
VVSVGYSSVVDGSGLRINFWEGTNHIIATYPIVQGFQTNAVLYQSVDGVTLRANAQYGISVENPYSDSLPVAVYSRQGDDGSATFDTSPFPYAVCAFPSLDQRTLEPFTIQWRRALSGSDFPVRVGVKADHWLLGKQSAVVLANLTQFFCGAAESRPQSCTLDDPHEHAIVLGSENQISLPKPTGIIFYRLIAQ